MTDVQEPHDDAVTTGVVSAGQQAPAGARASTPRRQDDPPPSDTTAAVARSDRRGFTFPTAYTILFLLLIVMAVLTWIIPAGRYDLNPDGAPIPGTFHNVPQNPQA